ncbi:hypothetical protein ACU6U9_08600 [Pseudomonas sp. HK3]|jgi:hypothetical protein
MKIILFSVIFFMSASICATSQEITNRFSFEGVAYDVESKAVLYTERHDVFLNKQNQYEATSVVYVDAQDQVFAKKSLDFTHNLMTPLVYFEDSRVGTLVEVTKQADGIKVRYQSESDAANAVIEQVPMMVVDAGFDQMLIQHWDTLLDNKELDFEFLAPTRAQLIDFSLTPVSQGDSTITFSLAPSNFLLRLLVDPIKLTYDKSTKRILVYEGLTNIEEIKKGKPTGDYYVARIEYHY